MDKQIVVLLLYHTVPSDYFMSRQAAIGFSICVYMYGPARHTYSISTVLEKTSGEKKCQRKLAHSRSFVHNRAQHFFRLVVNHTFLMHTVLWSAIGHGYNTEGRKIGFRKGLSADDADFIRVCTRSRKYVFNGLAVCYQF